MSLPVSGGNALSVTAKNMMTKNETELQDRTLATLNL